MEKSRGDQRFYDRYHQKNQPFTGVITDNTFTYFYWVKMLSKYIPSLKNLQILDVGCGVGSLSLYCASQGALVTGIDISKRAIAIAQTAAAATTFDHPLTFHCQTLEKTPGVFDLIICSEVIEHVPDEHIFFQELLNHLKPNGLLILSTPNSDNWLRRSGRLATFDASVGHLRLFNPTSLRALVTGHHATIVDSQLTEGPLRMLLFSSWLGCLIRFIRGPLVPLFHKIDHVLANFFGWHDQFIILKKFAITKKNG